MESRPGDWLTYDGNLSGNRYSELTQINRSNVSGLVPKWIFSVPLWAQFLPDTPYYHENMKYFGLEVTPLVADGIMYITGPHSAFALDAVTGRPIWQYSRPRTPGIVSDASLGTNRGAAILGDKIFMVTDNAHLIALNRTTGSLVWEAVMPDEAAALRLDGRSADCEGHGDRRCFRRRLGHSRISRRLQGRDRRTRLALLDRAAQRRTGLGDLEGEGSGVRRRLDLAHRHLRSPKPILCTGPPPLPTRIPTIATGPATTSLPNACWRSIPIPES